MNHKREFILLCIFNILDVLTTIYFLEFTTLLEANPLGILLLQHFGYIGIIIPKLIFLGMLGYALMGEDTKHSKVAKYGMRIAVLAYLGVVIYNVVGITLFYI